VAVQVYLAMWTDMVAAGKTADYRSPHLADHAASQALLLLSQGLLSDHQDGVVLKGQLTSSPHATGVSTVPGTPGPVAVSIVDCLDSTHWLEYNASNGQLKDNKPGGKHLTTATVGLLNGTWKVTKLTIQDLGTCT
jgi:hypothetical protein